MELGQEIEEKLEELRKLCQFGASEETVKISFHLDSNGWNTKIKEQSADHLREQAFSMKNLKGKFIIQK